MPTIPTWVIRLAALGLLALAAVFTFDVHRADAPSDDWNLAITLSPRTVALWLLGGLVAWWARRRGRLRAAPAAAAAEGGRDA